MRTSELGIELIKHFEGLRLKAYLCPAKKWTIGWGTTFYPNGNAVQEGDTCTEEEAHQFLLTNLIKFEECVYDLLEYEVEQWQFDALISFVYNFGCTKFKNSTLLKIINVNPNASSIPAELSKWKHANGRVEPELVRRRAAESVLYTTGQLKFD